MELPVPKSPFYSHHRSTMNAEVEGERKRLRGPENDEETEKGNT